MFPAGLKILSKSVAFAARFLTPLFLLLLFGLSNVLKLNEFKVSRFILDGFCNNENFDGLGRIVCPVLPLEDPFLNANILKPGHEHILPVLVSTTKVKEKVVINADSSTPSSLYLLLEACSEYRGRASKRMPILEDLCSLLVEAARDSDVKYTFEKENYGLREAEGASSNNKDKVYASDLYHSNSRFKTNGVKGGRSPDLLRDRADRNALRDESHRSELVKWRNVASLIEKLPSGRLAHFRLLASLNKSNTMARVLNNILNRQVTMYNSDDSLDLLVTSDILSATDNPFKLLADVAFPDLIGKSLGTLQESVKRLFLSFPEASAGLLHMRKIGFNILDFASLEPEINRFTFLAVFLSSLQLLLTYSFESAHLYNGITQSSHCSSPCGEAELYGKYKFTHLLHEFSDDKESKDLVEAMGRKLSTFAVNLTLKKRLFSIGEIGLSFSKKFLLTLVALNLPERGSRWRREVALKLSEALVSLGKFVSFDFDNDGIISFEEFTKGSIDMNDFVKDVISAVDSVQKGQEDTLEFVNLLKSQNSLYDKIIDEFIISDTDKDDNLSLEEFFELSLSTCIVENIHT